MDFVQQLSTIPIFPQLWVPHCMIMCQAVKSTLIGKKSLHKTNPLSLLVISILYTYPGGILSQLILGKPPLLFLTNTAQFLSFMAVWYIMFYTRLHTLLVNSYTLPLLLLAQDLMRLNLVTAGVRTILADFPDAFLYPVLVATVKSSGFMVIKFMEHTLLHGLNKPFTIPHHSAKTMILAASLQVLQHQGSLAISQELLFTALIVLTFTIRIITTIFHSFKSSDPYNVIESSCCSVLFGEEQDGEKEDVNRNIKDKKQL